jgi:hypothetical protein
MWHGDAGANADAPHAPAAWLIEAAGANAARISDKSMNFHDSWDEQPPGDCIR